MRISNYVIGAPLSNQPYGILLHGLYGAIDKVPRPIAIALGSNAGRSVANVADAIAVLRPSDIDRLISRGYLTNLSADEERSLMLRATAQLHERDLETAPV
jgi:uncharacterized protein